VEFEADDLRDEHDEGLAKHGRLGLDAAYAPTDDPKPIDHGCVRISSNDGIRICDDLTVFSRPKDYLG
jgi:hypothetical protein